MKFRHMFFLGLATGILINIILSQGKQLAEQKEILYADDEFTPEELEFLLKRKRAVDKYNSEHPLSTWNTFQRL